jgi:type II secretory pathway pseudopilin PulG
MNRTRGFTLIELIVSIGIMILISTMIFFNFPRFRQKTAATNAARDISLMLRDAQARATATSLSGGPLANNYGVYIDKTAANNKKYILFTDSNLNNKYDPPGSGCSGECIKSFTLTGGAYIKDYQLPANPMTNCSLSGASSIMVVVYRRPDPSTDVLDNSGAGATKGACSEYGPYIIILSSQDGSQTRKINIWRIGQVSITPPS